MAEEMLTLEWLREGDVLYGDHNSRGVFRDAFGAQMGWQQGGAKIVSMPDDILLVTVSPHIYAIGKKEAALAHITRVERDGVQIFPPPECPFKKGDRVRPKPPQREKSVTVEGVRWSTKDTPHWRIRFTEYLNDDLDRPLECTTDSPADGWEFAPEPPAFKKGQWVLFHGSPFVIRNEKPELNTLDGSHALSHTAIDPRHLKPYEPPVAAVRDIILAYDDETCPGSKTVAEAICDRYILIEKDKP